ncbi:helitron_like_N domain-containing protein [Trichonephila clavipes]|nr:helitron_like_N domain-containing protein [Trichonephila clavipes]
MCCASGKVKLPELHSPPEPLSTFLSGCHVRSISCKTSASTITISNDIVRCNEHRARKLHADGSESKGKFIIMPDRFYHCRTQITSSFKFIFMANSDEQIEQRCHYNAGTRREIVGALQGLFDQHNELVRLFKTAIQRMPADDYAVVIRADKRPVGQHERQFNAPTIDEVAIVIVGEEFESHDIILHRRSGDIHESPKLIAHTTDCSIRIPVLVRR